MVSRLDQFVVPQIVRHVGWLDVAVLDDGCGVGALVEELRARGADSYGVDPGARRREWEGSPCVADLFIADGTTLPFGENTFDVVLSSGVLEHVGEPEPLALREPFQRRYIREALRVVKPGGLVLLGAPNGAHPIDYWHSRRRRPVSEGPKGPFRVHWPYEPWMPNARDIRRWVAASGIPASIEFLSPEGYLSFRAGPSSGSRPGTHRDHATAVPPDNHRPSLGDQRSQPLVGREGRQAPGRRRSSPAGLGRP